MQGFYFSWGDRPVLPKQPPEKKSHSHGEERPQWRAEAGVATVSRLWGGLGLLSEMVSS